MCLQKHKNIASGIELISEGSELGSKYAEGNKERESNDSSLVKILSPPKVQPHYILSQTLSLLSINRGT